MKILPSARRFSLLSLLLAACVVNAAPPPVRIVSVQPDGQFHNPNGRFLRRMEPARFRVVIENPSSKPLRAVLAGEVVGNLNTTHGLAREAIELKPRENRLFWMYWRYPGAATFEPLPGPIRVPAPRWGHQLNVAVLDAEGKVLDRGQTVFAIDEDGHPEEAKRPSNEEALTPKQAFELRYCGYLRNPAFSKAGAGMRFQADGVQSSEMLEGEGPSGARTWLIRLPSIARPAKATMAFDAPDLHLDQLWLLEPDRPGGPVATRIYFLLRGDAFEFELPSTQAQATLVAEIRRVEPRKGDGGPDDTRSPVDMKPFVEKARQKSGAFRDLLQDSKGKPITTVGDWQRHRQGLRENAWKQLGVRPEPAASPLSPVLLSEERVPQQADPTGVHPAYTRRKVSIELRAGERMNIWVLIPDGIGPFPGVIVPHQTQTEGKDEPVGLGGAFYQVSLGVEMVARGYVVVAPDSPTVGERWDPRTETAWDHGKFVRKDPEYGVLGHRLCDFIRTVDYLAGLPFVEPGRLGSLGHSCGGEATLALMAMDDRLAAGAMSGNLWLMRSLPNANDIWMLPEYPYFPASFRKHLQPPVKERRLPFDFDDFAALWAPRPMYQHEVNQEYFPEYTESMAQIIEELKPLYKFLGAEDRLRAVMSNQTHSFPTWRQPEAFDWMDYWIRGPRNVNLEKK